jgi:hypothetical protein
MTDVCQTPTHQHSGEKGRRQHNKEQNHLPLFLSSTFLPGTGKITDNAAGIL